MSYPKDLDEYDDEELEAEINRRKVLVARGVCPYCKRQGITVLCKMKKQHQQAIIYSTERETGNEPKGRTGGT